jgi:hypothetical protein
VLVIANSLPHFETFQRLRDDGIAAYAAVLLWLAGVLTLRWRARSGVLPLPKLAGTPGIAA